MKKTICLVIFALFLIVGCSNNKEHQIKQEKKTTLTRHKIEKRKASMTEAQAQKKIKEGKAIMLSEKGEESPLKMEGSKVKAIKMPNGTLWQVNQKNGKTLLRLPDGKVVQEKMVNGKMMLLTDDNKEYEVEVINGKMMGILQQNNNVAMENK